MTQLKIGKELYEALVKKANEQQMSVKRLIILILTDFINKQ